MSISLLEKAILEKKSVCIMTLAGIAESLPECFKKHIADAGTAIKAIGRFDRLLIDILHNIIPAVNIRPLYYLMCGTSGMEELEKTVLHARNKGLYSIIDYNLTCEYDAVISFLTGKSSVLGNAVKTPVFDSVTLLPCLGDGVLQQFVFTANKYSKALFVSLKNGYDNIKFLDELSRQAAPVKGYSNVGLYLSGETNCIDIRKKAPLCFILCDEPGNINKMKEYFDYNGNGAAVCFSSCINKVLQEGEAGDCETKIYECVNNFRLKLEMLRKSVSDINMLEDN